MRLAMSTHVPTKVPKRYLSTNIVVSLYSNLLWRFKLIFKRCVFAHFSMKKWHHKTLRHASVSRDFGCDILWLGGVVVGL